MSERETIHDAKKVAYSSIVGQSIMLLNESGACIAQLSVINTSEPQDIADQVVAALKAPNRHAYKVGVSVGKASAQPEPDLKTQALVRSDGRPVTDTKGEVRIRTTHTDPEPDPVKVAGGVVATPCEIERCKSSSQSSHGPMLCVRHRREFEVWKEQKAALRSLSEGEG